MTFNYLALRWFVLLTFQRKTENKKTCPKNEVVTDVNFQQQQFSWVDFIQPVCIACPLVYPLS